MKSRKENRVEYFSKEDMSGGHYLSLAEPILRNFNRDYEYDINDIIELYQIKLYIDNDLFLTNWSEQDKTNFKEIVKEFWNLICKFWTNIDDDNITFFFENLEIGNQRTFWDLLEKFENFKNISEDTITQILIDPKIWIREVLHQKKLGNYFGNAIREFLIHDINSAELLLTQYEEKHTGRHSNLYFPKCLSISDKEEIVSKYLDNQNANLNYIRLIINSRDSKDLKLSPQTRLKAIKLEREKNNEILEDGFCWSCGCEVSINKDQSEPVLITWSENTQKAAYGGRWIEEHNDNLSLFNNFSLLFDYTDSFGLITLVSKTNELDMMEKIMMKSKNEDSKGITFRRKSNLSHLQIFSYLFYLQKMNKSIGEILSFILKEYFNNEYGISDFKITFPTENTTNLEKIRMIAPEFESVIKQYKIYVSTGKIDHELLQISSEACHFEKIPSLVDKNYVYGYGQEFEWLRYTFFSDQSGLYYVKPFENKYQNLYGLLVNENVRFDDFMNYQKTSIEKLISDGYLVVNANEFVKIQKTIELYIIGRLHKDDVVSYWHSSPLIRSVIDDMYKKEMIYFGDTLFSEPEQKYFNYYLNKSEFTNGLDLRNRYVHGTNVDSDNDHLNVYYIYLKLLVLAILKIENDLFVKQKLYVGI
jgi:hypothetical protein